MSDNKLTNFNMAASLRSIDRILNKGDNAFEERKTIPAPESLTFDNGFYVDCAALCVDIRDSSQLPRLHTRPVLAKLYRAYISEVTRLMASCRLFRHSHIVGDAVMGIFNVPFPNQHLNEIFLVGTRISGLVHVLNDKLQQRNYTPIRIGIGMSYGRALMIKAGYFGSTINDIIWMGDVVNEASKLSNYGSKAPGDEQFMVAKQVYEKLSDANKTWFSPHPQYGCHHGSPQHQEMIKLHERIKQQRLRAPSLFAPRPSTPMSTLLNPKPSSPPTGALFGLGASLSSIPTLLSSPSQEYSGLGRLLAEALMDNKKK